jgi:membrane dipeptidase
MVKMLCSLAVLAVAGPLLAARAATSRQDQDPTAARARRLLREVPVIDGHNDYPWAVHEQAKGNLDALDIRQPQPSLMTDIPRLTAGGVGGQFWSVYVPVTLQGADAVSATLDQIDIVHRMIAKYPDTFALALTADDVERIERQGKIASLIGVEGGHSINESLGVLRMFSRLGARYMTLTHTSNTSWADSATDTPAHNGLSPFGEDVVREMNRLGMLVDLSHVAPATMAAAMRVSTAPVIFSHSSARALTDVPRNVPDDILRQLAVNGGVIMATFVPGFVSADVARYNRRDDDHQKMLAADPTKNAEAIKQEVEAWHAANPAPRATLIQVADHIDHLKAVAGIDHVGLGSDFDGITSVPIGLEDTAAFPRLIAELLRRGYTDDDIKKIAGRNILRVMRQAEEIGKRMTSVPMSPASLTPLDAAAAVIVALGDSTTAGTPMFKSPIEAPPSGSGDVKSQYAYWLMQAHADWQVLNRGVNGERSDQVAARFDRDVVANHPRVVVIIAGVNDVYQGRPVREVETELRGLYDRAARAHIPVVAGSIIPYNSATPEQNAKMRDINTWIALEPSRDRNVTFVDTRRAAAAPDNSDRLAGSPDGLHPDVAGYRRMAEAIEPVLRRLVAGQ